MFGVTPVLVFLGPSAPPEDVARYLPEAELRPPVARGDLYAARLMRYSVFVIIDGVFHQDQAIPPREVVDVLEDGARVIGAASMGALRACVCWPAGAQGLGQIYRMFRHGLIGSEDEVAAVFNPARPFPALNEPLANIRLAARRARRAGLVTPCEERALVAAAQALPFADRSWSAVTAATGIALPADWRASQDAKRHDVASALKWVARRCAEDAGWASCPRRTRGTFGVLDPPARQGNLTLPRNESPAVESAFAAWMLLSGRANRYLDGAALDHIAALHSVPAEWWSPDGWETSNGDLGGVAAELREAAEARNEYEAEYLRFLAAQARLAGTSSFPPPATSPTATRDRVAIEHRFDNWAQLCASLATENVEMLRLLTDALATPPAGQSPGARVGDVDESNA